MRYRLVILDFDGTLADSFPWFLGVFNGVADRYGFPRIVDGQIETLRGLGGAELLRRLRIPRWKLPFIARHMRRLKARDAHTVRLFPGVDAALRALHDAGTVLAIVSSNSRENVVRVLGPENASLIRDYECGASLLGKRAAFRRVLRRSGIPAGEALAIGDELRDLEAARAVGLPFAAVTWGYTTGEALRRAGPERIFERVEEIAAMAGG